MHVLILHPSLTFAEHLQRKLKYENVTGDIEIEAKKALVAVLQHKYQAVLVYHQPPGLEGFDACQKIQEISVALPVIVLCPDCNQVSQALGKLKGAACVMDATSAISSIVQALKNLTSVNSKQTATTLRYADIKLDLQTRLVKRADRRTLLRHKEFNLLEFFMKNHDMPLPRTKILEHVWDGHIDSLTNTVDVHVSQLRKKIDFPGVKPMIKTIYCLGYVFGELE